MIPPVYQFIRHEHIQLHSDQNANVKIIAGNWQRYQGPIQTRTPTYFFDITIKPGGNICIPINSHWGSLIFVYEGSINYQDNNNVSKDNCCVLEQDKSVPTKQTNHTFSAQKGGKFVLMAGEPTN